MSEFTACKLCGVHEKTSTLVDGVCVECANPKNKMKQAGLLHFQDQLENRFLVMGFWEFAIISTLMAVFFPWSLLFCVVFLELEDTKFLVLALVHDLLKTLIAVLSIILPIIASGIFIMFAAL